MARRLLLLAALLATTAILTGITPSSAHAATHTVCAGSCDFSTIQAAINAATNGDVISIAPGTYPEHLTIPGSGGATQLTLQKGLGEGSFTSFPGIPNLPFLSNFIPFGGGEVVVDGTANGTVLFLTSSANVSINDLTFTNGRGSAGGITNFGTLRLTRVRVTNNQADFVSDGAGIFNAGQLEMSGGEVSGNVGDGSGGGILHVGNGSSLTLRGVVVRDNQAFAGGGLYVNGTAVRLEGVQFRGNTATGFGGGLFTGGNTTGTAVTVTGNRAGGQGGGIVNVGGLLTLTDSFIRNNTANTTNGSLGGGGVYLTNGGSLALTRTVVEGNTAAQGGGLYLDAPSAGTTLQAAMVTRNTATVTAGGGGIFAAAGATLTRTATLIALNTPTNCAGAVTC